MDKNIIKSDYKKFRVEPNIPQRLEDLTFIAYNLWMAWNQEAIKLFVRIDYDLWEASAHNPVKMLGEISQERLEELAGDDGFCFEVRRVRQKLDQYLKKAFNKSGEDSVKIGYFSLEYGLNDSLPLYSGGLGILSGDHVKSSSDLGIELYAVGLLYQKGYFQQYLNQDGWQQDFYNVNDFYNMQIQEVRDKYGREVKVFVEWEKRKIYLKIWEIQVGRVKIFLLDANIPENSSEDRELTSQLYGGDRNFRIKQEIILGIGGIRIFEKRDICLDVIHMNEGHSAFATFERCRLLMKKYGLSYKEAFEVSKKSSVFTTHTPVPAGNDEFESDRIKHYFSEYVKGLGIKIEDFIKLGRIDPENSHEKFSMTVLAIKNSTYINGVSKLHAKIAKKMWADIWKNTPFEHVPIRAITNGIHTETWIFYEMEELFKRYLGDRWHEKQDSQKIWNKTAKIPHPELWSVHELARRRLIRFVRERVRKQLIAKGASEAHVNESEEVLNPEALTIGFARRFATYKRGDLILRDRERILRILSDEKRPVQFVIAGKAHPQDNFGKEIIKKIIHFIHSNNLSKKIVFIEDYDMNVARYMVQGVDVWLNNPLRPLEACGTSGMKAAVNGVLNLSVMDGWWDEAYDHTNGWSIGNGEEYEDRNYQDHIESEDIYSLLENDIIPLFYKRGEDNLPREWLEMMKRSFISIASRFNTQRMIKDYNQDFYEPAASNFKQFKANEFKRAKELTVWKERIAAEFKLVGIKEVYFSNKNVYKIGDKIEIQVDMTTGSLSPEELNVSVYLGKLIGKDEMQHTRVDRLTQFEKQKNGCWRFSGTIVCEHTGNFGFKVRVSPHHEMVVDPYETGLVLWS